MTTDQNIKDARHSFQQAAVGYYATKLTEAIKDDDKAAIAFLSGYAHWVGAENGDPMMEAFAQGLGLAQWLDRLGLSPTIIADVAALSRDQELLPEIVGDDPAAVAPVRRFLRSRIVSDDLPDVHSDDDQ